MLLLELSTKLVRPSNFHKSIRPQTFKSTCIIFRMYLVHLRKISRSRRKRWPWKLKLECNLTDSTSKTYLFESDRNNRAAGRDLRTWKYTSRLYSPPNIAIITARVVAPRETEPLPPQQRRRDNVATTLNIAQYRQPRSVTIILATWGKSTGNHLNQTWTRRMETLD